MRLNSKQLSPNLVPGHSNFPVHPKFDRCITVREAACITGFPTNYKFFGSHSKKCEQVGNAVPPHLSTAIARQVKDLLDKFYSEKNKNYNTVILFKYKIISYLEHLCECHHI